MFDAISSFFFVPLIMLPLARDAFRHSQPQAISLSLQEPFGGSFVLPRVVVDSMESKSLELNRRGLFIFSYNCKLSLSLPGNSRRLREGRRRRL
jgi:hypothetical protein